MRKLPASDRRRRANRANALKSTGPRVTLRTRLNALKHGFFSKEVVIVGESVEEYLELAIEFRADLRPIGYRERLLADLVIAAACCASSRSSSTRPSRRGWTS